MQSRPAYTQHHFFESLRKFQVGKILRKSGAGYTMIELLVTIGIIGILAGVAVPSYAAMQRSMALNNAAQDLADAIRTAQTRALTSQANANHAIECLENADHCSLVTLSPTTTTQVRNFTGGITVLSPDSTVTFERLTGRCVSGCSGPAVISVGYAGGAQKSVSISPGGQVSIQ